MSAPAEFREEPEMGMQLAARRVASEPRVTRQFGNRWTVMRAPQTFPECACMTARQQD